MTHRLKNWPQSQNPALSSSIPVTDFISFITFCAVTLWCVFFSALTTFAQSSVPLIPENAHTQSYGDGWECDVGFRGEGNECVAIVIPQNAIATNKVYGSGWLCTYGYKETVDGPCVQINVPKGGYLDSSGTRWKCSYGYQETNGTCVKITAPPNGYLIHSTYDGSNWKCNRGYAPEDNRCVEIVVPENAFLNSSGYGKPWTCDRLYFEQADQCIFVKIPENAYFDDSSYDKGWKCFRGFAQVEDRCEAIELPMNAHFDRSGNRWECHRNFRKSNGQCVREE